jgi:hypothetical protein
MCNYLTNNLQYNLIKNSQTSNINDIELHLYYKKNNYNQIHLFQIIILLTIYYYLFIKIIIYYIHL